MNAEWVPNFEGQRPPFQPGNQWRFEPGNEHRVKEGNNLAVTHGIYSAKIIEPLAEEIVQEVLADEDVVFLHRPGFRRALVRYARAAARVERLEEWISNMTPEQAAFSERGQTSPLELLRKWQVTADNEANRLGLDPTGWARVRKDFAVTRRVDLTTILTASRSRAEAGDTEGADALGDALSRYYPELSQHGGDGDAE